MYPKKGTINNGSDADITMVDLKKEMKVSSELFGGFSDYIVYEGWTLTGWPVKTILRGKIIAEDSHIVGKTGFGKLIKRPVTAFN